MLPVSHLCFIQFVASLTLYAQMASEITNSAPLSARKHTLAATRVLRLTPTWASTEEEAHTLFAAPTNELAHKPTAPGSAQHGHKSLETKPRNGTINGGQPCHSIKLPPELRISIYELISQHSLGEFIGGRSSSPVARIMITYETLTDAVRRARHHRVRRVLRCSILVVPCALRESTSAAVLCVLFLSSRGLHLTN